MIYLEIVVIVNYSILRSARKNNHKCKRRMTPFLRCCRTNKQVIEVVPLVAIVLVAVVFQ